jgi:phosphonoacetate hydrolase
MARRVIIVCLDGCGPEYLHASRVPFLKRVGDEGCYQEVESMIPSVTNVNAVSLLTGTYPKVHGITSNYSGDRATGQEVFMESPGFIKTRTLLETGTSMGLKTALLTSKEKLRTLLHRGATISFSSEQPPSWLTNRIGLSPAIYSVDVDLWLMKALREVIRRDNVDLIYVMTTDYTMHKYAPDDRESRRHMEGIDAELQEILDFLKAKGDEVLLGVTADHGMSAKDYAVNLEHMLAMEGIPSRMNTIIADRYVVHHRNLGGAAYIYLKNAEDIGKSVAVLNEVEGVESVLILDEASKRYHLDRTRIGDILVLGAQNTVFGLTEQAIIEVSLRSHGSLYERRVPLIINQPRSELEGSLNENKDVFSAVLTSYFRDRHAAS